MTAATLAAILISNYLIDLNISDTATYTAVFGLLIASLLSRVYTMQMSKYETELETKNKQLEDIDTFETFSWITDIQNLTEPLFENKNIIFITEINETLPTYLKGDAARLLQITVNLISNASKYTQTGEVKLSIGGDLTNDEIFQLNISVRDTGSGIAENKLENIFEAFHQVEYDRTTNKGVGLGLSICKHLADIMNANMQVTSTPGSDSCFSFEVELPVATEPHNSPCKTEETENTALLSVLLVDDEAVNRMATRTLLEQRGHTVIEAENGQLALEKIKTQEFDVVLMDIHMPVLGGIETTIEIRKNLQLNSKIPIIGLTASVMSDERHRYLASGMNAVVEKPVMIEKLIKTIQQLL